HRHTQILWLNLVTDGFFVFALGLETEKMRGQSARGTTGDNRSGQKIRHRTLFDRLAIFRMSYMGIVMAVGSIFLFASYYHADFVKASTMAMTALAVFQWFNAWNVRSENETIFSRHSFGNPFLIVATLSAVVLQLAAIYVPFLQKLLHTKPLSFYELSVVVGIAVSIILVEEVRKYFTRRYLAGKFSNTNLNPKTWINPQQS
ncbi:MAG: cation-translocating P-type ATPase C-terminal domain-containing protein, partial [Patescibacteria group bacterium]